MITRLSRILGRYADNRIRPITRQSSNEILGHVVERYDDHELNEFLAVFPDITRNLDDKLNYESMPHVMKWYKKALQHNVDNRRIVRGLSVVRSYKVLEDPEKLTPENIWLAHILGWCVELLEAWLVVVDDIIDDTPSRRGAPSWHTLDGVGLNAITDSLFIQSLVFYLLKKHFRHLPTYAQIVDQMRDITMKTVVGQVLDLNTNKNSKNTLENFTLKRYKIIARYKTTYICMHNPFILATHLANKYDSDLCEALEKIFLRVGEYIQVENDYLDCYGDPLKVGKPGVDIASGKCTWLIVMALEKANPFQVRILEMNYGKRDTSAVNLVKCLYNELEIPEAYAKYGDDISKFINNNDDLVRKYMAHDIMFETWKKQ